MKFYIVDNGTEHLPDIINSIGGQNSYVIDKYFPGKRLDAGDADIVILSGGMKKEVYDTEPDGSLWYQAEFDFIRNTNKPILGICLGLQMAVVALGGSLKQLPALTHGSKNIILSATGSAALGLNKLNVFEAHKWVAGDISRTGFEVWASSDDGIELLHHPARNILATQFHPEVKLGVFSDVVWQKILNALARQAFVTVR